MTVAFVRDIVRAALTLVDATVDESGDICVALTEACANAIEHAHGAIDYDVTIDVNADRFTATVTDQGVGLEDGMTVAEMPGPEVRRGRGMPLMRALADDVTFTIQPGIGTTVQLIKLLSTAAAPDR